MINNKWNDRTVINSLEEWNPLYFKYNGIQPISIIDPSTGNIDIILLITDEDRRLLPFKGKSSIDFNIVQGAANTSCGPLIWNLFIIPKLDNPHDAIYEFVLNPFDNSHIEILKTLSALEYIHIVIASNAGEVTNSFEFVNTFGIEKIVNLLPTITSNKTMIDFNSARHEFFENFTIEQLLGLNQ